MKEKRFNVGVVGVGYVGSAVSQCMRSVANIKTYDKYKESDTLKEVVDHSDIIFVCVPTPMKKNSGICDTSIVEQACLGIARETDQRKIIVIKSTVVPKTTEKINSLLGNKHTVVFNPEFLTEANWKEDFLYQDRIILGHTNDRSFYDILDLHNLYFTFLEESQGKYNKIPILITTSTTAELLKYVMNSFLATKVMFFNSIYEICEKSEVDYSELIGLVESDNRIGKSHMKVPGPDGDLGFAGSCFPKDINGLINYAESIQAKPELLKAVWSENLKIRKDRNWESMLGRAISED